MRIAFFSWEYPPFLVGGLGVYSSNMVKKFVENGNEVYVFTLNLGKLKEFEEEDGVKIYRPHLQDTSSVFSIFVNEDLRRWGSNLKIFTDIFDYNLFSSKRLVELNKSEKFDLIVVHDWLSAFSGLILKQLNTPTVFHLHSCEEQRNFMGGGSEVLKNLEKEMGKAANKIVTVSNSMREFLISIGYEAEKIVTCYNGCDPEIYNPRKVNLELVEKLREKYGLSENTIFFIGRIVWFKGIYNLVKAMPIVLKDFPDTKLIIVGLGWDSENLVKLIEELGLKDKVILVNRWLEEEEKIAHYSLADVCVFPSLTEPFGIVASEAMAMEKPVVVGAARVSGFKEQVIPSGKERTGVHVNGESPEDIAWGIKEVLRNREGAKKWGKNGRKRVLKEFTWEIAAKKTLDVYKKVLNDFR